MCSNEEGLKNSGLGTIFWKFGKLSKKLFIKLWPAYSVKLAYSAKFHASRHLHFEDTKRIMSPKMCQKSFRTFKKWAPKQDWNPDLCDAHAISQNYFFLTLFYVGRIVSRGCGVDRLWGRQPDATLPVEQSGQLGAGHYVVDQIWAHGWWHHRGQSSNPIPWHLAKHLVHSNMPIYAKQFPLIASSHQVNIETVL